MREARGSAAQPDWLFPRLRRACDNRRNDKQGGRNAKKEAGSGDVAGGR